MPLALASIYQGFFGIYRQLGGNVEIPETADILDYWCLPFLAGSIRERDESAKAQDLFDFVKNLSEKAKK